jgi:DNA-binding transcriptional MerR regulator
MTLPESDGNRLYSQEDVQTILNLAIAQQAYQGEFSRSQLFEIGLDLGVPEQTLKQAEDSWRRSNRETEKRNEFNQVQRAALRQKTVRFAIVNSGLVSLNALTGFGFSWSLYVLVFWSLFLGLDTWNVLNLEGEAYEKAFQRWHRSIQVRKVMSGWLDRLLNA